MKYFAVLTCMLLATPLLAQNLPDAGYFTGSYELVGRAPGPQADYINDQIILQAEDDTHFTLKSCHHGTGRVKIGYDQSLPEGASPLTGTLGEWQLHCRFINDGDNYPRLTCIAETEDDTEEAGLLTLWPNYLGASELTEVCE